MSYIVQTPQRPLPGAYLQTPAGSQYQSSATKQIIPRSSSGQFLQQNQQQKLQPAPAQAIAQQQRQQQGQVQAQRPATQVLSPVERAAKTINYTLSKELRYPELDNYVGQGISSEYDVSTSPSWAPFQKVKVYPIPDKIFMQYNRAEVSTMMGIFADLNHAWVAIDNALYLWDYTHPDLDLVGVENQPSSITAVRLVYPRAGVFVPSIKRLLAVATTTEIILVGLSSDISSTGKRSVALYQTRMSVPTKGLNVNIIEGSATTGRIFFSSRQDNDVYELTYQQDEKWFHSKCGKILHTSKGLSALVPSFSFGSSPISEYTIQMVVDDSRSLLYTLSSKSTIRVFHMKPGTLDLVITKPLSQTLNDIGHKVSSTELIHPNMGLTSIHVISALEASKLNLMATTSTGCRIFMSATSSYGGQITNFFSSAPSSMQVHHVKFPPPVSTGPPTTLGNIQGLDTSSKSLVGTRTTTRYPPGYFCAFVQRDQHTQIDSLFISAPDSGRIARPPEPSMLTKFSEFGMWLELGSRAEDIGLVSTPFSAASTPVGFANELAVQYDKPTSEVAILTNTGIHTFRRRRLVDMFASTLRIGGSEDGLEGEVKKFIRLYGRGETASAALAVACGQGLDVTADERVASITDPDVLAHARTAFIEFGGKPLFDGNSIVDQSIPAIDMVRPSPRHEGLSLYMTRLIRSIWKARIAAESVTPGGGLAVLPTVSLGKLRDVQKDLLRLKEFLDTNKSFIEGLAGPEALGRVSTKQEEISQQAEHRALHALVVLISNIIEGISFVLVLFDERIEEIVLSLSTETRQQFRDLTFEGLFCSAHGKEVAKELVKAIVNRNIANGSNVDTVAEALRRRCGSFCSAGDVVIFKAQEQLKKAAEAGSNSEYGRNLLNESLRLFKQVAENMSMEQLQWAVEQYLPMEFFGGAIELCLVVAKEMDRGNRALSWIQDGRSQQDPRAAVFASRKKCYDLIHRIITTMIDSSQGQDAMDGPYSLASKRRFEAQNVIDTSEDEVFQTDLYDWYLAQDQPDRLLAVDSPFVITYLQRRSLEDVVFADLLWRYYSQANRPHDAAKVQFDLAKSDFDLLLDRRIEYLSRAKTNAQAYVPGMGKQSRQTLLRDIGDLLDIANIQDDILQRFKGDPRWPAGAPNKQVFINEINGQIRTLTDLYNKYADQANYHDICLLIYNVAGHRNPIDIKDTWRQLLEKTHEDAMERNQSQPFELIADVVRKVGLRLNLSETTFPIVELVPILERYAFEYQRGVGSPTWVMDTFLELQVPCDTIFSVLETMIYADEAPFRGPNRRAIANDMLYVAQRWFHDTSRGKGRLFGSDSNAASMLQTLQAITQMGLGADKIEECQALRMRIDQWLR